MATYAIKVDKSMHKKLRIINIDINIPTLI